MHGWIGGGCRALTTVVLVAPVFMLMAASPVRAQGSGFQLEEASIQDIHNAIQDGRTTCRAIVQAYIDRARAYNGICTALVTEDGAPIAPAAGAIRTGVPLSFPIETVPVAGVLPDFEQYAGPPIEFGRMEATVSDPSVQQQFGMRIGIPDAGQLNALETLNIRGERSVTCKAGCDAHPSTGELPASCPQQCDALRRQPDALERAMELDARYSNQPDLEAMPMYCVVFSWKNWYDARDMRSTGGNDVNFAMDVPPVDSPDIANLRDKGAISFAIATARSTGLTADGPARAESVLPSGNTAYGEWGGQACNPYDTARVPRGTSNGSGVSVAANLVTCSICEQTAASCKGPASRNNVVNLLTTKGILMHGGLGYENAGDRAGIHCRTVEDAARVLDAMKGYEAGDIFTAIPESLIPETPYSSFVVGADALDDRPLRGVRVALVREFMAKLAPNDAAISDQIDREVKTVLRDRLGAYLVESVDPLYPDDPDVPNMKYTFQDAFAEILPHTVPEYFWQTDDRGELEFAVPGWDVRSVDYAVALALGKAPLSPRLTLRRISAGTDNPTRLFSVNKYLAQRGDARITDWASWVANAKWKSDDQRAGSENAVLIHDRRTPAGELSYLKMQAVLRMVILKVMYENGIDVFVNPENTLPPFVLGGPGEPSVNDRGAGSCCARFTALLGGPEIEVPAGYTRVVYEPQYVLSADRRRYTTVSGMVQSLMPYPMPISLMLWSAPGSDADVIKVASAYEAATRHRVPPPMFGPLAP